VKYLMAPALLAVATLAAAQSTSPAAGFVNGEPITEDDLLRAASTALQRLAMDGPSNPAAAARARLEALHRALDVVAEERMLALEAASLGTTPERVLEAEVESNVAIPSREEVTAYYERNISSLPGPREEALAEARQRMIDTSRRTYRDALLRRLKREYGFRSLLEPLRTEVATVGHPSRGPDDAPVTIVEFSDFECPFCGALFPTLKAVEKAYPDTVRIVYRQFPLTSIHPRAQKAAEASLCAFDQGKFWEMHDSLFENQRDLTVEALKRRAADLQLDVSAFNGCLDSGRQAARVKADMADGATAGVRGTPTLFVNGRIIPGNQPAELRTIIEDELKRAGVSGR
jgi:predicted DsbA family dithiol-disulfide isomerase